MNSGRYTKPQDTGIIFSYFLEHNNGPLPENCTSPQYQAATVAGFELDEKKEADKCSVSICGEIVLIHNVAYCSDTDEPVIIGKKFKTRRDFYETPSESPVVDEHVVRLKNHVNRPTYCFSITYCNKIDFVWVR